MKSGLQFLLAARRCEIAELERLSRTSELVGVVAAFTHGLQRERGISNIFLASRGQRFAELLRQQHGHCDRLQQRTVEAFRTVDTEPGHLPNGARLFNRIAAAMHGLEGLPGVRAQVGGLAIAPRDATAAYNRLVASLLAVVFEAADSAGDPEISRALVALFNFMQCKEFAGQERAHGAVVFTTGRIDEEELRHWRHLVDLQQQAAQVFAEFGDAQLLAAERASQDPLGLAQVERLRQAGWALGGGAGGGPARSPGPGGSLAAPWYEAMTERIDAMRGMEELIGVALRELCGRKIAEARALLEDESALLARPVPEAGALPGALGPQLERSVLDLVQEQGRRLQAMGDELESVRATLKERKLIERAKGLLMAHRQIPEDEAYKLMRQMAMNQKRRLGEVAEALLSMAEVLPPRSR